MIIPAPEIKKMSVKELKNLFNRTKKQPLSIMVSRHKIVTIKHDPNSTNLYAGAFETYTDRYEYDTNRVAFTTFNNLLSEVLA